MCLDLHFWWIYAEYVGHCIDPVSQLVASFAFAFEVPPRAEDCSDPYCKERLM
jgi:hypothetical protein